MLLFAHPVNATRERAGKTYYVMVDARAFRDGAGRLLAEVQRIKSQGDVAAAKARSEPVITRQRTSASASAACR